MYKYERHFGSFYHNPQILETVLNASKWVKTDLIVIIFLNTMIWNNSSTDVSLLK